MEKELFSTDLKPAESAQALWDRFENTGSIETYLRFLQQAKTEKKTRPTGLSFLPLN